MFQRHLHRHDDVNLVMSALRGDPQRLLVLIALGAALRSDVASALREVIATGAWMQNFRVRREAAHWRHEPRFQPFLDHGFERRRDRGPKYEHLQAALLTYPETRAALLRVYEAECPQHCRTETAALAEDRHIDDYREALFGWYAAIQYAHACLVRAVRWWEHQDPHHPRDPDASESFTDWMAATGHHRGTRAGQDTTSATHALQELILMMHAWSPHTLDAIDVAFRKTEGENASHAWGGGFEPAGRPEAQAAAEALASILSSEERQQVRDIINGLESDASWDRDMDLAVDVMLPCTSDQHRSYSADTGEREACANARGRVFQEASQSWSEGIDRAVSASRLARFLLGARADRVDAALAAARADVSRDAAERAPQIWHDNAKILSGIREAVGLDIDRAAGFLGIKRATLQRFEQAAGKVPGRRISVGYLQLLTLTCAEQGQPVPDSIPQPISEPAISLPTAL
ncbi:hypothetical protein [Streptomyces synnematoformans]